MQPPQNQNQPPSQNQPNPLEQNSQPPQGYYQQPQYNNQQKFPTKKSSKGLLIGVLILAAIVIIGAGYFILSLSGNTLTQYPQYPGATQITIHPDKFLGQLETVESGGNTGNISSRITSKLIFIKGLKKYLGVDNYGQLDYKAFSVKSITFSAPLTAESKSNSHRPSDTVELLSVTSTLTKSLEDAGWTDITDRVPDSSNLKKEMDTGFLLIYQKENKTVCYIGGLTDDFSPTGNFAALGVDKKDLESSRDFLYFVLSKK